MTVDSFQTNERTALLNCVTYGERLLTEIPQLVQKTIERRDKFPTLPPERLAEGLVSHMAWRSALESSIDEAKKLLAR